MKNIINLNKKLILVLLLLNILIIGTSYSYSLFETTTIKSNIVKLQAGNTDITTTIENYSNNTITLNSNEEKELNVTLNNITNYNILYKMYYTITSGSGTVIVTDGTNSPSGTMNNNKNFTITIKNTGTSSITIVLNTKGALSSSSITLDTNQYELIMDITPPTITNIKDAGSGKITFTATDTGSGVATYCVNQSSTNTSSCNWLSAISGTQTTGVVTATSGTFYVHVKDNAGNIGHSSAVSITIGISAGEFATSKVVSYSTASASDFSGGLVAINTDGTLYNNSGTIREYRFSGATVNNYVFLDTNGDGVKDSNEIWRIIGIFKNSNDEWNVKIMRNTTLTNSELPATYTYNGTAYKIRSSDATAYWNVTNTATNENDWTTAVLQYWLNDSSTGYWSTISNGVKNKVDTNYTYYLGNFQYGLSGDTTITAYTYERLNTACSSGVIYATHCSIWYGNKATWNGAVALLYPSDYGYSANSSYWTTVLFNYNSESEAYQTSWMQQNANHNDYEWLLSPSSNDSDDVAQWDTNGGVYDYYGGFSSAVRPCLNLLSSVQLDTNHTGDINDPFLLES